MRVRIKFCGLTRAEDVAAALALGSDYVGVVFAGGPRQRTLAQASRILRDADPAQRAGIFGAVDATELRRYVAGVPLAIAQLHGDPSPKAVMAARAIGVGAVWSVVGISDGTLGADVQELFQCADAVVLDTKASNGLGGTGRSFDWAAVADALAPVQRHARLVIAGGLTPDNVGRAIEYLRPDVVDVSSGVESAPGIKDPILMSRFVEAVRSA